MFDGKMVQLLYHSTHQRTIMILEHRSASEEDSDEDEDEDESSMMNWVIPPVAAQPKPAPPQTTNLKNNLVSIASSLLLSPSMIFFSSLVDVEQAAGWCNG